jgi:putative phosphoesterase
MLVNERRVELNKGIIGLISDTHGLVRPEALAALKGVELIIHGGDIGKAEVLDSLNGIAPVLAIRGNNDRGAWARQLPDVFNLQINGIKLHVIHDVNELAIDPVAHGVGGVISGHSHKPGIVNRDRVLFINPGSAGPRRFKLPIAVGKLFLRRKSLQANIIELKIQL